MKHMLSRGHVEMLAQLAWSRVVLAFDFLLARLVNLRNEQPRR